LRIIKKIHDFWASWGMLISFGIGLLITMLYFSMLHSIYYDVPFRIFLMIPENLYERFVFFLITIPATWLFFTSIEMILEGADKND